MATRLTGMAAIEFAERSGVTLSKRAEPSAPTRDGLTPAEARKVAARNPDLVYIEFDDIDPGPNRVV